MRADLPSAPGWTMSKAPRSEASKYEKRPGPGHYDAHLETRHTGSIRAPAYTMDTGGWKKGVPPAEKPKAQETPGPGGNFGGDGTIRHLSKQAEAKEVASKEEAAKSPRKPGAGKPQLTAGAYFGENLAGATNVDWSALSAKLPTGKDADSTKRRHEMWRHSDPNGNGYLSSAEVDLMVRDSVGEEMFSAKPVIQRAFHAARRSGKGGQSGHSGDYVEKGEFRMLLLCLRQYYELYAMFNRIDTSDDRRIDLAEFKQSLAQLRKWKAKDVPAEDDEAAIAAEFEKMDTDGGGKILFGEFCDWAVTKDLDLEDDDDNVTDEANAAKAVGYIAAKKKGGPKPPPSLNGPYGADFPPPRLCYTSEGLTVPLQTTAVALPEGSPTRLGASPVFAPRTPSGPKVLAGQKHRMLYKTDKFLTHAHIPAHGHVAGLPYAFGQLLLEKSNEYRESLASQKAEPSAIKD